MEEQRYYRSVGLTLRTWRLIDAARGSAICLELYGKFPSDSQVMGWLLSLGTARLAMLEDAEASKQVVV